MSSKRDQIAAAFVTALSTTSGKPSGLTVHRQRTLPIASDILPAQVVYLVEEAVKTGPMPGAYPSPQRKSVRTVTVRVESRVSAGSSTTDQVLDPLLNWAVQKICVDPTLGGIAHDTVESSSVWLAEDLDKVYGACATDFSVTYITDAADPTALT